MIVKIGTSKNIAEMAISLGRFLTSRFIQPRKLDSLLPHEMHGASLSMLRGNEISSTTLMNVRARRIDAFLRCGAIVRVNCRPALVNITQ
jgi:hypothetical protein